MKILFVSVAFPPKFDSESLQVERIVRELLKRKELEIDVVTANPRFLRNMPIVNGMEDFSSKVKSYHEVAVYENRWINKALGIIGLINIPDAKWTFTLQKANVLKNILNSIDVVYSRSFPPSSSLLAKRLVDKLQVPWVMHLSDPWNLNPLNNYSWFERKFNSCWERRCLERATLVSFTTEGTMDLYKTHYPEISSKFFLSYNSVAMDKDEAAFTDAIPTPKLKIVHTGLLNRSRSPGLLIKALKFIKDNYHNEFKMLDVIFVGAVDRYVQGLIESNKDIISYRGVIGYEESKQLINSADVVLVFDNEFSSDNDAVFLPSKLLDYAAARKRIACVTHSSWQQLAEFICSAVDKKNKGDNSFFITEKIPERFTTQKVVDQLVEKFELLTT
jgi:hypothetical protein